MLADMDVTARAEEQKRSAIGKAERVDFGAVTHADPKPSLAFSVDFQLYMKLMEDSDASEADKLALIEALWSIVVSFVDLGFQVSPLQQPCKDAAAPTDEASGGVMREFSSTCEPFASAGKAQTKERTQP